MREGVHITTVDLQIDSNNILGSVLSLSVRTNEAPAHSVTSSSTTEGSNVRGAQNRTLSEGVSLRALLKCRMLGMMQECGTYTVLGVPVVPDVVRIYAVSDGIEFGTSVSGR